MAARETFCPPGALHFKEEVMKKPLFVLSIALLSTLAIMCSSMSGNGRANLTPELRQVVQVESAVTGVINSAIRDEVDISICPPEWPGRHWNSRGIRVVNQDPESRKATIEDLQQLRELVSRRADQAFLSKANPATFNDLLSVKVTGKVIEAKF
jgi:hypothetical protein